MQSLCQIQTLSICPVERAIFFNPSALFWCFLLLFEVLDAVIDYLKDSSSKNYFLMKTAVLQFSVVAERRCSVTPRLWYCVGAAVQYYASPQVGRLGLLKAVPSGRRESDLQIF